MNLLVSYHWLKEFVATKESPAKVAELLSLHALSTERLHNLAKQWEKMVVGKIVKTEKHPNADKLTVNMVDVGGKTVQIICGAPNVRVGMFAAVALPGSRVRWHGEGDPVTLAATKIRGVESFGMMCAANEIGLEKVPDASKGILDLSWTNAKPGTALAAALDMDDVLMDVEMTSNRPDAMSVVGVAREVAAITGAKFNYSSSKRSASRSSDTVLFSTGSKKNGVAPLSVVIHAKKLCTRFAGVMIDGVKVGSSPWWMQKRLMMAGLRPINNIVDITNYVMLEQGKPLHAFDAEKITEAQKSGEAGPPAEPDRASRGSSAGHKSPAKLDPAPPGTKALVVRTAEKGERLQALDGKTYLLNESMLVVADAKKPLAIAGVMGGEESGVTEKTTAILFESAVFDPVSIRRTARALNLHSEASNLFEKGLSNESVLPALIRAVALTLEIAGGHVASKLVDVGNTKSKSQSILLRSETIARILGIEIPLQQVKQYLEALGFEIKKKQVRVTRYALHVTTPWWRDHDVTIEEDLVEEIGRLYGYHRLPAKLPDGPLAPQLVADRKELVWEKQTKEVLRGAGYTEIMSYSFVPRKWLEAIGEPAADVIAVANPLTDDLAVMRTTLVPSLLAVIAENQERSDALHLFEFAKTYRWDTARKSEERLRLAIAVVRKSGQERDAFRMAKGIVHRVLTSMGVSAEQIRMTQKPQSTTEWKDPSQSVCIEVGGVIRGYVGIVRQAVAHEFGVDRIVAFATLKFDQLILDATMIRPYQPLAKYPSMTRDLAFIVSHDVAYADLESVIRSQPLIAAVELFDLYEGEKIGAGKKSLAFRVTYQSPERTLTTEEVNRVQEGLVKELAKKFGAVLRDV